ncbi:growth/differentiation factor 10 [Chanos chanos]|uniref:Growth/differentiation factor 10 n=1 Tax=Chanos chanos TaxID=29144 RepID=A0A6J2VDJ0_CHACN|nr:growth/differentiation factor 10-like [Chanos chanos]
MQTRVEERREVASADPGDGDSLGSAAERGSDTTACDSPTRDMMSINMYKIYDKFTKDPRQHQVINTARSFKSVVAIFNSKILFQFNLTSIPESEVILSATFHFLDQHARPRAWRCKHSRGASCRMQHLPLVPPAQFILRSTSPNAAIPSHLGHIIFAPNRKGSWQIRDMSSIIKEARARNELLISAELQFGERPQRRQDCFSPHGLPYILVYANDLLITEPNSVAMSLQRYNPFPVAEERGAGPPTYSTGSRVKREADHLQNNYLPDFQYNDLKSQGLWDSTYFPLKPKSSYKSERQDQDSGDELNRSQELNFDEKTMKKARRKQLTEPRACARRYLRVDFADIGWSEWVLAPKAFDAYYCAGTCGFPISKVGRPSNHATIQSIVRAVGIVPGVPEPCCVPDKMSPLPVLYLDTSKNMVVKVYHSMSVETCACR